MKVYCERCNIACAPQDPNLVRLPKKKVYHKICYIKTLKERPQLKEIVCKSSNGLDHSLLL